MRARSVALLLVAALLFYFAVVGSRGLLLVRDGRVPFVLLGVGVLLLPLIGGWVVYQELRFGAATQALARELATEGGLPVDERVADGGAGVSAGARGAADAVFERRRAEVEAAPGDWRAWYRLAVAYDDAGDTARGRRSMRRAIALHPRRAPRR